MALIGRLVEAHAVSSRSGAKSSGLIIGVEMQATDEVRLIIKVLEMVARGML